MLIKFIDLGLRSFAEVLELQKGLRSERQAGKIPDTILTVEHPKVITKGRRPAEQDFLVKPKLLKLRGFAVEEAGRGGKLTYHGPGQLVAYFILSLTARRMSIPIFVRTVEDTVIRTLAEFQIDAGRRENCPGVWVDGRKIASIGLSIDRGVSMHGVALNIDPDLKDFEVIVPCGINNCQVTSMRKELNTVPPIEEIKAVFQRSSQRFFS